MFDNTTPKNRQVAIVLAFASVAVPVAGFHKFYLGQPGWGLVYLLLSWTPIPHVASAIEAVWYLTQDNTQFQDNLNAIAPTMGALRQVNSVATLAESIRELDKLRADGLISEYEFEQKRRQYLDRV
ncbi:NINE protein [Chamaesiphon sp. OTE_20_metabat_361]|uniref:NINE protein n=1 Tax=Chamaesiphon sp. OTE_20_metabat_361 TaxID=2964689 RepID=UPI00286BF103|nr:NINE protein [Chamaesiphon sp. OTE_20_metabat_361]